MRVLILTSEWPTRDHPEWAPFIVEQVESLRASGVEVTVYSFRGNRNLIIYLANWIQIRQRFSFAHFDLIHAHFGQSAILALPPKLPLVITFHGSDLQGYIGVNGKPTLSGQVLQQASRQVAKFASQVILVSEKLSRFLPPRIEPHIIPCGLDFDHFRPLPKEKAREILGLEEEGFIVLFLGNPSNPIKRHPLAVEVISHLAHRLEVTLLTVFNEPHKKIPLYLNAADALLLTSSHEGSPNVVKEALACNIPVVSVDVGDVAQRIGSIDGCVVCENDRVETIVRGLSQVLARGERIESRESVKHLDQRIIAQRVISVYEKALG